MKSAKFVFLASSAVLLATPEDVNGQWERFEGPEASQVNDIESHGAYLYASTDEGIFRSEDDGSSWAPVNEGLPTQSSYLGLIGVGSSLIAWVMRDNYDDERRIRSNDKGESWADITSEVPEYVDYIFPAGDRLFAADSDRDSHLLYMSTDYGDSWQATASNGLEFAEEIWFDAADNNLFAWADSSIFKSDDYGDSWVPFIGARLVEESWIETKLVTPTEIILAFPFAVGDSLFLGAWFTEEVNSKPLGTRWVSSSREEYEALFRSTDNGKSWTLQNWERAAEGVRSIASMRVIFKEEIPFGYTGRGVYRYRDDREYWQPVSTGLPADDGEQTLDLVSDLVVMGDMLFAGTWDGVYMSTDDGENWFAANSGLPSNNYVHWMVVVDDDLFACIRGHGIYVLRDKSSTWASVYRDSQPIKVHGLTSVDGGLFASTEQGLYRSADDGDSWTAVKPVAQYWRASLVASGNYMYVVTYDEIYRSSDDGNTWKNIRPRTERGIGNLVVSGTTLFYSGYEKGLFRSTNNGESWADLDDGTLRLFYGYTDMTKAGDRIFGHYSEGTFMSANDGDSWTMINDGLPADFWGGLTAIGSRLFGRSQNDVFMFNQEAAYWVPVVRGLPESNLRWIDASSEDLFAYTRDAGIWRLRMSQLSGATE